MGNFQYDTLSEGKCKSHFILVSFDAPDDEFQLIPEDKCWTDPRGKFKCNSGRQVPSFGCRFRGIAGSLLGFGIEISLCGQSGPEQLLLLTGATSADQIIPEVRAGFLKSGYLHIIHVHGILHEINHPFLGGTPMTSWKPP